MATFLNKMIYFLVFISSLAEATVHFTLRGSVSNNNYGLLLQKSVDASLSVSFDVGPYLRLGGTHREEQSSTKGWTKVGDGLYMKGKVSSRERSDSLDLTIVLYYGELFVPYIQVGRVTKILTSSLGQTQVQGPFPNAGLGLSIRLNANFSLNLTHLYSLGVYKEHPAKEAIGVFDTYSAVGITYNI